MLLNNRNVVIYRPGWANGFDPTHPEALGKPGVWKYEVPSVTWENVEEVSRANREQGTARRVQRRSKGNSLPLVGLRPAMRLKQQQIRV
jgi:hypothetical protein